MYQGDYDKAESVGDGASVLELAKKFDAAGADYLHLVDLNGAKKGGRINQEIITEAAKAISIPVEVGGGIRTLEDIAFYLNNGVSRVILGTKAISDPEFLREAVHQFGDRIAVGLDCKDGYVCTTGWTQTSKLYYTEFARVLERLGVKTIIFTDISRDGTLSGPNLEMLDHLRKAVHIDIIASGGVRDLGSIESLKGLGLYGAVTGKSLYAGTLKLEDALETTRNAD
jgi:phosphoribosylformimino-5-aminoimidazole carboxamide ribotide isomerase